jgi:DNA (cytosine-5)-methyltransferase 1
MALIFDAFMGAGGWHAQADDLGLRVVGFDLDRDACATARAAGMHAVQDDLARLVPVTMVDVYGEPEGFCGSPPCTLYSTAGKGQGRRIMQELHRAVVDAADGASDIALARHRRELRRLLREHLRESDGYKRARTPRLLQAAKGTTKKACEASPIRRAEVSAEAGRLARNASLVWQPARWVVALRPRWVALEQVPAVLPLWKAMAQGLEQHDYRSWVGILSSETYGVAQTRKRAILIASLDGQPQPPEVTHQVYKAGELAREGEANLFGLGVLPWVSMAQCLGWEPSRINTRGDRKTLGGNEFDAGRPSWALTEKVRSWQRVQLEPDADPLWKLANGTRPNRAERAVNEPAPALHFGSRLNNVSFVQNARKNAAERGADELAPCIAGSHDTAERQWALRDGQLNHAAAALQSFPPDWLWQGSRTSVYTQIGNAIPPLMARRILMAAMEPTRRAQAQHNGKV